MNTPFDALEQQLHNLRPSRLPAPIRRRIVQELEQPVARHHSMPWSYSHRIGLPVALAGALSLALLAGSEWLPRSPRKAPPEYAGRNAPIASLAFWESELVATSPIGANKVAVLCSPSMLTNLQLRR